MSTTRPALMRYPTQIWGTNIHSRIPRHASSVHSELSSEQKHLVDSYYKLSDEKRKYLTNFIDEEYDDERLDHHFMRLVSVDNIQYISKKKFLRQISLNYSAEEIELFIEWYDEFGCDALLKRETSEKLRTIIREHKKDGYEKEILVAIQYQQEGLTAQETKLLLHSRLKPLVLRHAYHLYNKHGLDYDLNLYSRRALTWAILKIFREPFNLMGLLTTILMGYKITLGNLTQIGINETESETELFIFSVSWMAKMIYDFHDKLQGYQNYSARFGHWLRSIVKTADNLLHLRNPQVRFKNLIEPFIYDITVTFNLLALILLLVPPVRSQVESFFEASLSLTIEKDIFPRVLKPFLFISTAFSLFVNFMRALNEGCIPCRECKHELNYENLVHENSHLPPQVFDDVEPTGTPDLEIGLRDSTDSYFESAASLDESDDDLALDEEQKTQVASSVTRPTVEMITTKTQLLNEPLLSKAPTPVTVFAPQTLFQSLARGANSPDSKVVSKTLPAIQAQADSVRRAGYRGLPSTP